MTLMPCLLFARLGETMNECDARYGKFCDERPPRFPGSKTRRVYAVEVFRLDIEFNEAGKAFVLLFRQAEAYRLEELRDKVVGKKAELEGRGMNHNDLWKDREPFEKLDWTAANYKDTEAVGAAAKGKAAERDAFASRAAEKIDNMRMFFGAFYPGAALGYASSRRVPGMAGLIYDIFQGNAGTAEWRSNKNLKPLIAPSDRASAYETTVTFEGQGVGDRIMGSFSSVGLHRSDRQAFACQFEAGFAFWSREADNSLIAYAAKRKAEIDQWTKEKGSKF